MLLCIGFTSSASTCFADSYNYTFYSDPDGSGDVIATYTGPLITPDLVGQTSGGFTVDTTPVPFDPASPQVESTALQGCTWFTTSVPYTTLGCSSSGNPKVSIYLAFASEFPTSPGIYNTPIVSGGCCATFPEIYAVAFDPADNAEYYGEVRIDSFEVAATTAAVPEPSALCLVPLGLAVWEMRRGRPALNERVEV